MNCCDDAGKCTLGNDCPARELPITMDEPLVTLEGVMGWIWNALAGVGILACIVAIGFLSAR